MDTINLHVVLAQELSIQEVEEAIEYLERIVYCDIIRTRRNIIDIKLSYPRFYASTNAYLISNSEECMRVHKDFVDKLLRNKYTYDAVLELKRVDIPFTYYMEEGEDFSSYINIFKLFAKAYMRKKSNSDPKAIGTILDDRVETLIYADTKNYKNYNSKIQIYNQDKKFFDYYSENRKKVKYQEILKKYPELKQRIRIEVSKRISRRGFTLEEFRNFNIYDEYIQDFAEYALCNILDMEEIENIMKEMEDDLIRQMRGMERNGRMNYEIFVMRNEKDFIWDYSIIKNVIYDCIENKHTRESAITKVRKILRNIEEDRNKIIFDTYKKLEKIEKIFLKYL